MDLYDMSWDTFDKGDDPPREARRMTIGPYAAGAPVPSSSASACSSEDSDIAAHRSQADDATVSDNEEVDGVLLH